MLVLSGSTQYKHASVRMRVPLVLSGSTQCEHTSVRMRVPLVLSGSTQDRGVHILMNTHLKISLMVCIYCRRVGCAYQGLPSVGVDLSELQGQDSNCSRRRRHRTYLYSNSR